MAARDGSEAAGGSLVVPAKAGRSALRGPRRWVRAFAGTTDSIDEAHSIDEARNERTKEQRHALVTPSEPPHLAADPRRGRRACRSAATRTAARWLALIGRAGDARRLDSAVDRLPAAQARHAVRREHAVDSGAEGELRARRRRHLDRADRADRVHDGAGRDRIAGVRSRSASRSTWRRCSRSKVC